MAGPGEAASAVILPPCDNFLAETGYTVFDIDYRLADASVHFPAQIDDVATAVNWIKAHSVELKVDPQRIALLGRSAGAQMALAAAYRADLAGQPLTKCVVSFYGPTDLAWDYANPVQPDVINARSVLSNYLGGCPG